MMIQELIAEVHNHHIYQYTINGGEGYTFTCLNYGATMTSISMPDKFGRSGNILLNYDLPSSYYADQTYFIGRAIGRVGGRIKHGSVELDHHYYQLPQNEGKTTLHGGPNGFHNLWWHVQEVHHGIKFSRTITSEEDGFPGTLEASIIYRWDQFYRLHIEFSGVSDADTLFNPTLHNYFNLNHDVTEGLLNHKIKIYADQVAENDVQTLPTGRLITVNQTPFDFHEYRPLPQMLSLMKDKGYSGYDHSFVVPKFNIAGLVNEKNGREIKLFSDRNSLVVFTLNKVLSAEKVNHVPMTPHIGIALEPQTLPDAIHHPGFGNILLPQNVKQTYHMIYELIVHK